MGELPEVEWPVDDPAALKAAVDRLDSLYNRTDSDMQSLRSKMLAAIGLLQLVAGATFARALPTLPSWYVAFIAVFAVVGIMTALPALFPNDYPRPYAPSWVYQDGREYGPVGFYLQLMRYYCQACDVSDGVARNYSLFLRASLLTSLTATTAAFVGSLGSATPFLILGLCGPVLYGGGWLLNNALTVRFK